MDRTRVTKAALLEKIRLNRATHRATFEEAQRLYRRAVIVELDKMLADAREGRQIRRHIVLPEPHDHTGDYDRAIAMLEMSVDDEVWIDADDFQRYVLDQWPWTDAFESTNKTYSER